MSPKNLVISKLTGTPFSSCILYLSNAAGLPVRSRYVKKILLARYTIIGITDDPTKGGGGANFSVHTLFVLLAKVHS